MFAKPKEQYGLLIGGEWVEAEGGALFETYNPATGELITRCANASPADVDRAVKAAEAAFEGWSRTSAAERAALLLKAADLIDQNAETLAAYETIDINAA